MNNLSIVLSTYNEAHNIEQTLTKLLNNASIKEVIIVDDSSTDNTVDIINYFKNDKIKLFIRKTTKGFASAFIFGVVMSSGKYILRFDLDMHTEIDFFIKTFQENKDKDCVIFSRYVKNGFDSRGNYRKISSLLLNTICQYLLSKKIKDYTSCIMFFKRDLLSDIFPQNSYYANFIIEFVFSLILPFSVLTLLFPVLTLLFPLLTLLFPLLISLTLHFLLLLLVLASPRPMLALR